MRTRSIIERIPGVSGGDESGVPGCADAIATAAESNRSNKGVIRAKGVLKAGSLGVERRGLLPRPRTDEGTGHYYDSRRAFPPPGDVKLVRGGHAL
jgi:hypothetical protein